MLVEKPVSLEILLEHSRLISNFKYAGAFMVNFQMQMVLFLSKIIFILCLNIVKKIDLMRMSYLDISCYIWYK